MKNSLVYFKRQYTGLPLKILEHGKEIDLHNVLSFAIYMYFIHYGKYKRN